jgi:lipopolysaccharide export LptBFGC system permease protein LptF
VRDPNASLLNLHQFILFLESSSQRPDGEVMPIAVAYGVEFYKSLKISASYLMFILLNTPFPASN